MTRKTLKYKVKKQSNSKNFYNNRNNITQEEQINHFLKTRIYNRDVNIEKDLKPINCIRVEGGWVK